MRHTSSTPMTLTNAEVKALLDGTSRADDDLRDHLLFSIALGTGLRISEIVALDVSDIQNGKGVRGVWTLRPETTKGDKGGVIALPDKLRRKVSRFLNWKSEHGESVTPDAALFTSRGGGRDGKAGGGRLSIRGAQHAFMIWQRRCGFDRRLRFHSLRHSFCTSLWRATGDLRLVQSAARHSSVSTTSIYAHPGVEDVLQAVQTLAC